MYQKTEINRETFKWYEIRIKHFIFENYLTPFSRSTYVVY